MKKTMLLALWLPLIAITFFTSCKKSSSLPTGPYQIRAYDNNYQFGGTLNGSEFVPFTQGGAFGRDPIFSLLTGSANTTESDFYCSADKASYSTNGIYNGSEIIEFYIKKFNGVGKYNLNTITLPYMYVVRPNSYGGYQITTRSGSNNTIVVNKYFLTNTMDTGYIECKKWVSNNDYEFNFNYTCRNSTVGDPDRSTKTIEGTVIKKP